MSNRSLKKFVGDYAYSFIKNIAVDPEKIRKALITPQNARNVFSELDEFQIKSICSEISANDSFMAVRETSQEEIIEDFVKAGYDTVIFDNEEKIAECEKYYAPGEIICTYRNLPSRMSRYHMLVAIKKDIDEIPRSKSPQRDDEYGTSILNIQIAKNGSHMSIKNRYNHTVDECDSTLNNNLDLLVPGLQQKVLGYYGMACLNNKDVCYKNIVKINGVYLKYSMEACNVYLGDFVLDHINGPRFYDKCRYYVDAGSCLIFDFKEKKVVNIFPDNVFIAKKSLLDRAMRESKLHSGNKNEANRLNIIFPDAVKELMQTRKNALKYIAEVYGYDFQKPFQVTGLLGKFTAKSIEKTTGCKNAILLVCHGVAVNTVELRNGTFDIKAYNLPSNMARYWRKSDFEYDRKNGKLGVFVIQQDSKYIRKVKKPSRSWHSYQTRDEVDKSGCNLTETRTKLQERLREYKAEKRKAEANLISYEPELEEVKNTLATVKVKLASKLLEIETSEEYRLVKELYNYDYYYLMIAIEKFENNTVNRSFPSVEAANNQISEIKERLKTVEERLK